MAQRRLPTIVPPLSYEEAIANLFITFDP